MWIDKPEEEKKLGQAPDAEQGLSVGAGAGSGPQVQSSSTSATGTPSSMSPTPQAPGQQFGTIQDYFKGSKQQGEKLGEQFVGKLDDTRQQQQDAIGQAAQGAAGQVAANTVGFNEGLVSGAVKDPTKIANDDKQYDQFMQQWNASYKGPESFEASDQYGAAASAAKAAQDKATQASSVGGRQQLLQDDFNVYGAGNKGLDESLVQQSSSFGNVGKKAQELNSLQDYLKTKSQDVQGQAQAAKATTEQTKQKTQDALLGDTGAVKNFQTDIEARTEQARLDETKNFEALQSAIANNQQLSDQQLGLMGISREQYNGLLAQGQKAAESKANVPANPNVVRAQVMPGKPGMNSSKLKEYLSMSNPNAKISKEAVAGKEDFAKDQALSKLTGRNKFLGNAEQRGRLVAFDKDKAMQDYLDSIGADQATRDAAEQERKDAIAAQEAEKQQSEAERTGRRELTQDVLGNTIIPGAKFVADPILDVIKKDKLGGAVVDSVNKNIQKPIENYLKDPKKEIKREVANVKELVKNPVKKVTETAKKVTNSIKKAFCFDGSTLVEMSDGSKKAIKDITLGEHTKGGVVESTRQSYTAPGTRYDYKGTMVTGSHAVKEDIWRRVADSKYARPLVGSGVVYSLVTSNHRIIIDGITFADEHETDQYEILTLDQSLATLNRPRKIALEVR